MNAVLKRLNEYKRDKLLEKTNNKCNKKEKIKGKAEEKKREMEN